MRTPSTRSLVTEVDLPISMIVWPARVKVLEIVSVPMPLVPGASVPPALIMVGP